MEKAILISINPNNCHSMITDKKRTILIRKNRPQICAPFKCYIYCTKDSTIDLVIRNGYSYLFGKIPKKTKNNMYESYIANGTVIGEFICDYIVDGSADPQHWVYITENSPLPGPEIYKYCGENEDGDTKYCFGWNISNLIIYDKPKELEDFLRWNRTEDDCFYQHLPFARPTSCKKCGECSVKHPPQSWCYVESRGD